MKHRAPTDNMTDDTLTTPTSAREDEKLMTIVLARSTLTKLVETGHIIQRDFNYFRETTLASEAKALIWLSEGTSADLEKARAFAAQEGYEVFTYPTDEPEPLQRARAEICAGEGA